jgi:hypothetical protein
LPDLDCQHFGRVHLTIQEFDDPSEFGGDLIRHENQTYFPRLEIGFNLLPKAFDGIISGI